MMLGCWLEWLMVVVWELVKELCCDIDVVGDLLGVKEDGRDVFVSLRD